MKIRFGECEACAVRDKQLEYLKGLIERLSKEKEIERAEFKRATDALLIVLKGPAIGQGSDEHKRPVDMAALLGYMSEPGEDQMETRHPDKVVSSIE
jgi:hypothetical protein